MVEAEAMDPAQAFMTELLTRHKAMNEATERGDSAVQQFYSGAAVFVTGGSGFLGKQLIEKLFRATKISKVFVLLRPKKGKAIEERLNEMLQEPVYDMLREQQPDFAGKVIPVAGDVAELRLGISDEDWNTIAEQVHIIFHLAATTRFDEPLRVATIINVRGTREGLTLGKACKNLKSFVHVSTAYSHACDHRINAEVLEDFYQSPIEPETLISLAESVDECRMDLITPGLINSWPNTYSFTKAIAEDIVRTVDDDVPICIVRPAIVICSQREPNPGWVDMSSMYGASGMITGCGLGIVHTVLTDDNVSLGLIPVDYVNNAIIAAGWETAKRRAAGETKTKIYTVTTSTRNPGVWGRLRNTLESEAAFEYATPAAVWFNYNVVTNIPVLYWIYSWLLHLIPAYIADGVCLVARKEGRFVKLFSKMQKMMLALSYFSLNNWEFDDKNTATLHENLSTVDREIFEFDVNKIDWREYIFIWVVGIRKYILKDELKGTEYGRKKQFYFKLLSCIIVPLYFYCLYKLLNCFITFVFSLVFL